MRAFLIASLLLFGFVSGAFAQAMLRVGDPVQMTIGGVPQDEQAQVNNVYMVDVTGAINLPYINKIRAEGLTQSQLSASVEQAYRKNKIFTNPTITIMMQPTLAFCECRRLRAESYSCAIYRRHDSAHRNQRSGRI